MYYKGQDINIQARTKEYKVLKSQPCNMIGLDTRGKKWVNDWSYIEWKRGGKGIHKMPRFLLFIYSKISFVRTEQILLFCINTLQTLIS